LIAEKNDTETKLYQSLSLESSLHSISSSSETN